MASKMNLATRFANMIQMGENADFKEFEEFVLDIQHDPTESEYIAVFTDSSVLFFNDGGYMALENMDMVIENIANVSQHFPRILAYLYVEVNRLFNKFNKETIQ